MDVSRFHLSASPDHLAPQHSSPPAKYNGLMNMVKIAFCWWVLVSLVCVTCFSQSNPDRKTQIQSHNQKAAEYLKNGHPDLAAFEFKSIIELDPGNVDARGNLGTILFFQGAYGDAIPQLRTAVKLSPTLWKTEALLGIAEKRTGDVDRAKGDLEKAFPRIAEEKVKIETGMELIEIYSRSSELDKAAAVVEVLRRLEPTDTNILYTAYRIYSDLSDESLLSLSMVASKSARMHQALGMNWPSVVARPSRSKTTATRSSWIPKFQEFILSLPKSSALWTRPRAARRRRPNTEQQSRLIP
jgi:tetratricopeptide (TPR) repeat protein